MKIHKLYFGDFGILRNETMESIHPGVVVIGGPNRAGKTTFMLALRHLGYKLPRTAAIPPPTTDEYDIQAEVAMEDGTVYAIQLTGYGSPKVSSIDNAERKTIDEIYNYLDGFSYRQIFTISLDELQRLPKGVEDENRLQAVLLGAGWADAVRIPQIREEILKEAEKIGGTRGAPVRQFKPYIKKIKNAVDLRKEANQQLDEYRKKKGKLTELKETMGENEKKLERLELKSDRLSILENNYEDYEEIRKLQRDLKPEDTQKLLRGYPGDGKRRAKSLLDEYKRTSQEHQGARRNFVEKVGKTETEKRKALLLEYGKELDKYENQISGWKERIKAYKDNFKKLEEEKVGMESGLKKINEDWDGDFSILEKIKTDVIEEAKLRNLVREIEKTESDLRELSKKIDGNEEDLERYRGQQQERRPKTVERIVKTAGTIISGALIVGFISGYLTEAWLGLGMGVLGIVAVLVVYIPKVIEALEQKRQNEDLKRKQSDLKDKIEQQERKEDRMNEELGNQKDDLQEYLELLQLPLDKSPDLVVEQFAAVKQLKTDYAKWKQRESDLNKEKETLCNLLSKLVSVIRKAGFFSQEEEENLLEISDEILSGVTQAIEYLSLARELDSAVSNKKKTENQIVELLKEENPNSIKEKDFQDSDSVKKVLNTFIDRGAKYEELSEKQNKYDEIEGRLSVILEMEQSQRAFEPLREGDIEDENWIREAFGKLYERYVSKDKVLSALEEVNSQIGDLKEQNQKATEEKVRLEKDIEQLATTENLEKAQKQIDEARQELEPLAKKYAVYNAAAVILDEVHQLFIEKTKGSLLNKASEIFKNLTGDTYNRILLPGDSSKADFVTHASTPRE